MKKKIFISLALLLSIWIIYRGYRIMTTRSHSPTETVRYSVNGLDIQVRYGRPYKKGRMIFGEAKDRSWLPQGRFWTVGFRLFTGLPRTTGALVPDGEYWRLGANDATEISFSKDVLFAGKEIRSGTYRMYAVPNPGTWQVSLNSETGKFGYSEPDYTLDVLKVDVPAGRAPSETEQFTINFEPDATGAKMNFVWDTTRVSIPIKIL